jgi:Tol biopolymer transport system component
MSRFTTQGGVPYRVAISPDGKMLVYLERIDDKYTLWLGQIETNSSVPLIQQEPGVDNLVFAPDGSSIYFNVGGANRRLGMLVRMAVLGGVITELIPHVDSPVTFAPGGKQMAFLRRDGETWQSASIIIADPDGQNQRALLSRKSDEQFSCPSLSWSPDGNSIAFSARTESGQVEVLSASVADGSVSRIGDRDWPDVGRVAWLPDGSALLVNAGENVRGQLRRIWLVPHPAGEARPITDDLNVFLRETTPSVSADGKLAVLQSQVNSEIWIAPAGDVRRARRILRGVFPRFEGCDGLAWTPDGRLLYTAYVGNSQVIWSMSSDGSDQRQLTSNQANTSDSRMCATVDGRYVVFQSNRSGSLEIWRVNSDGSNLKQLTTGGDNSLPSLSPDSRWIIYTAVRDGEETLWRISIDGGEPTQITAMPSSVSQALATVSTLPLWGGRRSVCRF